MAEWKIKFEDNDKDEDSEEENNEETESKDFEEVLEESEPLEDMLQEVPSKPAFRFNRQGVSVFLEQEPVENLEQDLRQVPGQTKDNEKDKELEQPINAPKYSSNYEKGDYESMRNIDKEIDISGGALITREREIVPEFQRRMDFNAWQQQNIDRIETQGEKYQIGKPEKFKQKEDLPFQSEQKPKRFG